MKKDFHSLFRKKRILVTGHSGFKGRWICRILKNFGAEVYGYSLDPVNMHDFSIDNISSLVDQETIGDIRDFQMLYTTINAVKPDFIFHMAAQSLVRKSIKYPLETFSTNSLGTCNLLEAIRIHKKKCVVVLITSDKVYENKEWVWGYRENDSLGGVEPYSASKSMAEIAISSYIRTYDFLSDDIRISIARAGNVIGGGDWSEDRIIPDLVRSAQKKKEDLLLIRSPNATRPWQHVLDPLFGYLTLASALSDSIELHSEAFNFGPQNQESRSVESICNQVKSLMPSINFKISPSDSKEASLLQLDCKKSTQLLDFTNKLNSYKAVEITVQWYINYFLKSESMIDLIDKQISLYLSLKSDA